MIKRRDQVRAHQKLVLFVFLVSTFSVFIAILQMRVPSGTRVFVITWSPFIADASKMWSVGIAGIVALLAVDHSFRDVGLRFCRPRYFIIAAGLPLIYYLCIYVPVWLSGLGAFRGEEYFFRRLLLAPFHLPLFLLLAAGEEIGWRGVLVPNVARTSGIVMTALLPGSMWAVWHWPDIIFFDFNAGTPEAYALFCFSISLLGFGVFLTWLRLASGSVWPPIVFHSIHNTLIYRVFEPATQNGRLTAYITTEFGIGLSAAAVVIACMCWANRTAIECSAHVPCLN